MVPRSKSLIAASILTLAMTGSGTIWNGSGTAQARDREYLLAAEIVPGRPVTTTSNEWVTMPNGGSELWTYTVTDAVDRDLAAEAEENEAASGLAAAAGVRCWQHHKNIRSTSANVTQYRWQHLVRWCFKGNAPHKVKANQGNNLGTGSYWNWRGNERSDATKSSVAFWRYKQGHYELCWPAPVGCFQNAYPAHSASYRKGAVANSRTWVR